MNLQELKQKSNFKVLLRGKSGRGKTYRVCKIALMVSSEGISVKYVDTEAEGAATMVELVEGGEFDEESLENVEYVQARNLEDIWEEVSDEEQEKFDVIIVDTLDHKHSFAKVAAKDDDRASDPDWNQYAEVYATEVNLMERLNKPLCNIVATLDPDSGSMDKDKGVQTNIHGYFSVVVDVMKDGDSWVNSIRNWVGRGELQGKSVNNLEEAIAKEIVERVEI